MSLINNLFPPLVGTYTAGFKINNGVGTCTVKFSLSPYTTQSEIKSVWVSIVNPRTNKTVVKDEFSTGLLSKDFSNLNTNNEEEIEFPIQNNDLQGGTWSANQTYKIQLRLCSKTSQEINGQSGVVANSDYFSEWSTPTLVTPTKEFSMTSSNPVFGQNDSGEMDFYNNVLSGTVSYGNTGEYLDQYRIIIRGGGKELYDSGVCHTDSIDPNNYYHKINIGLQAGNYTFKYIFVSSNLYVSEKEYAVTVKEGSSNTTIPLTLTAEEDAENGRMKLIFKPNGTNSYNSNILIKRASHSTEFLYWEDVSTYQITIGAGDTQYVCYDYTVDSGQWYHYAAFKIDSDNKIISKAVKTSEPVIMILNDIFLNGEGRQLKVQLDPNITSYQNVFSESSTQTIGGKYPYIKRNSRINYRQIGISGLISYHMDKGEDVFIERNKNGTLTWDTIGNDLFTSKSELYENQESLYNNLQVNPRVADIILERKFREKVMEFLLDGKPKLFRSPTESPTLIRLMNVSFSPKQELGRMVYSFSATGHEIADCTLENIIKYEIQPNLGFKASVRQIVNETTVSGKSFTIVGPIDYVGRPGITISNLLNSLTSGMQDFELSYANNVQLTLNTTYNGYAVVESGGLHQIDYNSTGNKYIIYYKTPSDSNMKTITRDASRNINLIDLGDISFLAMAIAAKDGSSQTTITGTVSATIAGRYINKED